MLVRMSSSRYRLVVAGEPGPRYVSAFEGMTIHAHDATDITGPIIDQSHLKGLLERIANLGLTLHSGTPFETENAEVHTQPYTHQAGVNHHDRGTHSKGP
jgi:hypothetical protein